MVDKIAALVAERDQAARAHDTETVERVTRQLEELAQQATTPAQRAAKRVVTPGTR